MFVYHYHHISFIYLGSESADPDPLEEGQFLLPANSTFTAPPDSPPSGFHYRWDSANEQWNLVETPKCPGDDAWRQLRQERNRRLGECDWMFVVRDYCMSYEKEMRWREYRQRLRDLPANTADPRNPVWPEMP